ncbi:penicillin-binding transpeptidase domain-containing protein [Nonomuraea sp. NEAU-A123]|uniref:penicillin-binding transpeptidase domain-containing protein n=1 Tax=Nonomuraea sp. NEAU-A123 TaxID=2839649 RepID=UPI001BE46BC2|nr:penicillin-binding transpeptidase domain-containing protein [Nonomuraea sp. NEAU-A123]MBT2224693.1 penicillin-binding protein [Nonomuraea sp. NEAU-A123]
MSRVRRGLAATVTLAVASMSLTACFEESSPHDAVRDFLVGWQSEDYDLAAGRTDGDRATVRKALADAKVELDAASFRFKIKSISLNGDQSQADFRAEVDLGENNPLWVYDSMLPLRLVDGRWKVHWSPSVLHPQLKDGQRFAVSTDPKDRQPVEDRKGTPLQLPQFLYVVGVIPSQLGDQADEIVEQLSGYTGFAQDRLLSRIRSSPPKQFVPLANFGAVRYRDLEAQLKKIPQLIIRQQKQPVAPDAPKDIVGKVSALTPETEQKLGGPQRAGDSFGQSGLQRAYQDNLTGSTRTRVITLDLKTDNEVAQLKEWPGRTNVPVRTTIDSAKQRAAEAAVAQTDTSALVAVDRSTGEILAVGTKGLNQEKDALAGKFPAGTAFSIVAADALIKTGNLDIKQKLACPAERTVGGARFVTASQATGASPTVKDNFAKGCVTALASLARRVDAAALKKSATAFGIEKDWRLPLKSFSGSLPPLTSDADKARAIAGQNVEVSPLSMALIAGAIASGSWHAPVLVTEPKSPNPSAEVVSLSAPQPVAVDPKVRSALTAMMLAGAKSSRALAGHTGVHGVTAAGDTEKHMGWFVGWQGEVAIAVLTKNYDPAAVAGEFFTAVRDSP